jgi:hypothetical protein
MAEITSTTGSKKKLWDMILKSMGFKSERELIENILVSAGDADANAAGFTGRHFIFDTTNNAAWFFDGTSTYTQLGTDLTFDGGMVKNAN